MVFARLRVYACERVYTFNTQSKTAVMVKKIHNHVFWSDWSLQWKLSCSVEVNWWDFDGLSTAFTSVFKAFMLLHSFSNVNSCIWFLLLLFFALDCSVPLIDTLSSLVPVITAVSYPLRLVVSSLEALESCFAVGSSTEKVRKTSFPPGFDQVLRCVSWHSDCDSFEWRGRNLYSMQ